MGFNSVFKGLKNLYQVQSLPSDDGSGGGVAVPGNIFCAACQTECSLKN